MNMNIKTNSKRIKKGDTFIALKGMTYDGHDYIEEAIENGAEKIICEHGEYNVQTIIVSSTKEYLNNYLDTNYYNKIKDITLIGITGTNGKTTSCYFIYELLKMLMSNTGIVLQREDIMVRIWGMDYEGESRTLDMHIKTLRHKLGDAGKKIRTVRNVGYQLEE